MEDFETKRSKYKYIHGARVPDISISNPVENQTYYMPQIALSQLVQRIWYYKNKKIWEHRKQHNLYYPHTPEGKDAAIAHAQAMLGIHPDQLI